MTREKYICSACRGTGEHRCHKYCDCPDCGTETFGTFRRDPQRCECEQCRKDAIIQQFLDIFDEKD